MNPTGSPPPARPPPTLSTKRDIGRVNLTLTARAKDTP